MTRGHGNATATEAAEIDRLEADLRLAMPSDAMLDLAQVYFEPVHAYEDAIAMCDTVLACDPGNARAKLWRAYGAIYAWPSDEELRRARILLDAITESEYAGGAWLLLAGLIAHEKRTDVVVDCYQRSIEAEPGWVRNRYLLAAHLVTTGQEDQAREQLSVAIGNLIDEPGDLSVVEKALHGTLTGKLDSRANLENQLRALDS